MLQFCSNRSIHLEQSLEHALQFNFSAKNFMQEYLTRSQTLLFSIQLQYSMLVEPMFILNCLPNRFLIQQCNLAKRINLTSH